MLEEGHHGGIKRGMMRRPGQEGRGSLIVVMVLSVVCVLLMYNYWQINSQHGLARDEVRILAMKHSALQMEHREVNSKNEALTREIKDMKSTGQSCFQKTTDLQKEVATLKADFIPKKDAEDQKKTELGILTNTKDKEISTLRTEMQGIQTELESAKATAGACSKNLTEAQEAAGTLKKAEAERVALAAEKTTAPAAKQASTASSALASDNAHSSILHPSASLSVPTVHNNVSQSDTSAVSFDRPKGDSQSFAIRRNQPLDAGDVQEPNERPVAPKPDLKGPFEQESPVGDQLVAPKPKADDEEGDSTQVKVGDDKDGEEAISKELPTQDKKKEFADFDSPKEPLADNK